MKKVVSIGLIVTNIVLIICCICLLMFGSFVKTEGKEDYEKKLAESCKSLRENMDKNPKLKNFKPKIALVLGSGLGNYGKKIKVIGSISYKNIKNHPVSTVPGHIGRYLFGYVNKVPVVCMQGRTHYYEGNKTTDIVTSVRLMKSMGAKSLIVTNAAGGVNESYPAGTLMMIKDHIALFVPNPLIGKNFDKLGPRFPGMSYGYDQEYQNIIRNCAKQEKIHLEEGVYAQVTGPSYETPKEVKMLQKLGADAVGMSTAIEVIAARHAGLRVCGISCITNKGAGLSTKELSHEEVQETANRIANEFERLITSIITEIGKTIK